MIFVKPVIFNDALSASAQIFFAFSYHEWLSKIAQDGQMRLARQPPNVIEVWTRDYFGEDDIVQYEDGHRRD